MKTPEVQRRARIGRKFLAHLKPIRTLEQVSQEMGLSIQHISLIEEEAAYKLVTRLRQELAKYPYENL